MFVSIPKPLDITSKLEINYNTTRASAMVVSDFAAKNRASAIVVENAALIPPMLSARLSNRGKYKIILAVDFPRGDNYVLSKFKSLPQEFMGADGFDIVLSNGTENEILNEIRSLNDFLNRLNPMYNVRYVLNVNSNSEEMTRRKLKAIMRNPPSMIRLDAFFGGASDLEKNLALVREYTAIPVKVSANVDYNVVRSHKQKVAAFDVTYANALKIIEDALKERTNPKSLVNPGDASKTASSSDNDE